MLVQFGMSLPNALRIIAALIWLEKFNRYQGGEINEKTNKQASWYLETSKYYFEFFSWLAFMPLAAMTCSSGLVGSL